MGTLPPAGMELDVVVEKSCTVKEVKKTCSFSFMFSYFIPNCRCCVQVRISQDVRCRLVFFLHNKVRKSSVSVSRSNLNIGSDAAVQVQVGRLFHQSGKFGIFFPVVSVPLGAVHWQSTVGERVDLDQGADESI